MCIHSTYCIEDWCESDHFVTIYYTYTIYLQKCKWSISPHSTVTGTKYFILLLRRGRADVEVSDSRITFMNNELRCVRRWRWYPLSNMHESIFLNARWRHFQRIFTLKKSGPRRIQPIFVLDVGLFLCIFVSFLADLVVFSFDILKYLHFQLESSVMNSQQT